MYKRQASASGGWLTAFTGVQIWPLIDRFWGGAASTRDGSAPLGVRFVEPEAPGGTEGAPDAEGAETAATAETNALPAFALWAPTALAVTLLAWETGDPTGSSPLVDDPPMRLPAHRCDDGRWEVDPGRVGAGAQYLWEVEVFVPLSLIHI